MEILKGLFVRTALFNFMESGMDKYKKLSQFKSEYSSQICI